MGLFAAWRNRRREKRRLLFSFWDGQRIRRADPFRVWRDIQNDQTVDLEAAAPLAEDGHEPEATLVVNAVAKAFSVQRWDPDTETGLADWEILDLLVELNEYLYGLKKKYSPGPTSPPPMVPPSSTTPAVPDAAMPPWSGSPSTSNAPTLAASI